MNFESWLQEKGYSESTVQSSIRMVNTAYDAWKKGADLTPYKAYLKRFITFSQETGNTNDFLKTISTYFEAARVRPDGERDVKPVQNEIQMKQLWEALGTDPIGRALKVILLTPHPASELRSVLEVDIETLRLLIPKETSKFISKMRKNKNLIQYLGGETYDTTYMRLRRRLQGVSRELGLGEVTFQAIESTPWNIRFSVL